MKKRTHIFRLLAASALLMAAAVLTVPCTAQAKAGKATSVPVELEDGKTYSSYDVTGNGNADKIKIKYVSHEESSTGEAYAVVYLNGKKKATYQMGLGGTVYLIAPTKKTVFLIVDDYGTGYNSEYLYRWQNGKFRSAYSHSLGENELEHIRPYKVTKNGFSVLVSPGRYQNFVNIETLTPVFVVNYKISSTGVVSLKSRIANNRETDFPAKAQYAWSMSSSYRINNAKGPNLIGGGTAKILKMYISMAGRPSFQVESEGTNIGWVTYDMYMEYDKPILY